MTAPPDQTSDGGARCAGGAGAQGISHPASSASSGPAGEADVCAAMEQAETLGQAMADQDLALVRRLLGEGANPNHSSQFVQGFAPLFAAAQVGDEDGLSLLLGEPRGERFRSFAGVWALVDVGWKDLKGDSQPCQDLAAPR